MRMIIKEWKMRELSQKFNGGFLESINSIEHETEKALLLHITWAYTSNLTRNASVWVPKAAIYTEEELQAEYDRFQQACDKYEQMIDWAKAQGVKVRKGMKKATILQKIEEAGLKYEA